MKDKIIAQDVAQCEKCGNDFVPVTIFENGTKICKCKECGYGWCEKKVRVPLETINQVMALRENKSIR
jgi:hypothetical protein